MKQQVSMRERISYALGDAGCNFVWSFIGSFLTLYYTDSVGISAAAVGTLMLITRLLDGVSDLAMGVIIDRTRTRWGKARPWLLFTAPFMAIGLILVFSVPSSLPANGKLVYAYLTYTFLAVIVYTACNLAYTTLLSLMTTEQEVRTSTSSIRFFVVVLTVLFLSYTTTPLVEKMGWTMSAVIFGVVGAILILIAFRGTKERSEGEQHKEKVPLKESYKVLFKNKYFLLVAILFVINYIGAGATNGVGIYYAKDVLGNAGIFGTLILCGMVPSLIGALALPKLSERYGKWICLVVGYLLQLIGYAMIAIMPKNIPVVLVALIIKSFGMLPHMAILFAMAADVVDYGEWKSGVRIDGMTYSAVSFGMKVGTGLGTAIIGWGLAWGGYDGALAVQSQEALTAIKAIYSYIPFVLAILGLIVLKFTNIDKIYPTIRKELDERREGK